MTYRLALDAKWSENRLWDLIEARTAPDADVATIDQRIWDLFGEEWAVLFTDLAGFSRRVAEFGILHFMQVIHESHKLLLPIAVDHDGILIKSEADSFLLLFRRPQRALQCALAMQRACQRYSKRRKPEEQVLLCAGIGYGRILRIGDHDTFGEEVNVASKLGEDTAKANEILLSGAAYDALGEVPGVTFEPLPEPVSVSKRNYRVIYPIEG